MVLIGNNINRNIKIKGKNVYAVVSVDTDTEHILNKP